MRNRFIFILIVFALFLPVLAEGEAPATVTLHELMADMKGYNGRVITVSGTVKNYYEKEDFSACLLFDNGKACSLYLPAKSGLVNESKATVTGTFSVSRKIGDRHFSNVVEVTEIVK